MVTIFACSLFLIAFGIFKPKSKIVTIALFLFMWLLIGWNTDNLDFENYFLKFNRFDGLEDLFSGNLNDPGYSIISILFKFLGFDYYQFKIFFSFISLALIYSTIRKFALYPALVSLCYFIFIFALDVTQFRNFISYSIVIYAFRFLFQEGRKGVIIYSILIIISSSIHSSSLFYILLLLTRKNINLKIVLLILLFTYFGKSVIYQKYSMILETEKLTNRYSQGVSIFALFSMIIVQVINAYYINIYKFFKLNNNRIISIPNKKRILISNYFPSFQDSLVFTNSHIIPRMSLLFLLLIPFYADNMVFSRIFKNMVILNFIYISNHKLISVFKYKPIQTMFFLLFYI